MNTMSRTVYLSSFEVCMLLELIPHPISLFSIIYFELLITRTIFDFPWRFELSGVDCRFFGIQDLALISFGMRKDMNLALDSCQRARRAKTKLP